MFNDCELSWVSICSLAVCALAGCLDIFLTIQLSLYSHLLKNTCYITFLVVYPNFWYRSQCFLDANLLNCIFLLTSTMNDMVGLFQLCSCVFLNRKALVLVGKLINVDTIVWNDIFKLLNVQICYSLINWLPRSRIMHCLLFW